MSDYASANASILVAVSQTSDPTGSWYKNKIDADSANKLWPDFPMLGFNKNWIVVAANMWTNTPPASGEVFSKARIFVFNKTNLYAGGTTHTTLNDTNGAFSIAPSTTYDNTLTNMYLLNMWNSTRGVLRLYNLTGVVGSERLVPSTFATNSVSGGWASYPPGGNDFGRQSNTTVKIQLNYSTLQSPVIYRNGSLWVAHTVFLPTTNVARSAVQWWQINANNGKPVQVGRIQDTSNVKSYAFPSIAVNRFNDLLIGYSRFSSNTFASGYYSYRDTCDTTLHAVRTEAVLHAGEKEYWKTDGSRNRWGDYSATVVDPVNDTDLWTLQQYARDYQGSFFDGSGRWGTWWGKIALAVPANDNFTNAVTLTGARGTNSGTTVRATRETGEPNHSGTNNSPSVWFTWTAPGNGYVRLTVTNLSTCGSASPDTSIAVYTGTAVNSLAVITNKHSSSGTNAFFNATSNTTYQIAVSGYGASKETFDLFWKQTNAPMITTEPVDRDVFMSTNVTFTVVVSAEPIANYQWRRHGDSDLNSVTNIAGATNSTLTLSNVGTNDTGYYSVIATNVYGTDTSRIAHLQVYSTRAATISGFAYTNSQVRQVVSGVTGELYWIEGSTNLINWVAIETNTVTFTNTDNTVTNYPYRFYRIRTAQ